MTVIDSFEKALGQTLQDWEVLLEKQKKMDAGINTCYHALEMLPLDAVQMMKVTTTLKTLLKERRHIKNELRFHTSLAAKTKEMLDSIKKVNKNIDEDMNRYRGVTKDRIRWTLDTLVKTCEKEV